MPTSSPLRRDAQAGFTLVELLVTVTIMSIAFVVILGAIGVFMRSSSVEHSAADLDRATRTYAERLRAATYVSCAGISSYPGVAAPPGFTAAITSVKYWNGSATGTNFGSGPCPADNGAQQLTVRITRTADGQQDQFVIVKRAA
jgi:prepilin-type N-terminal cleavage/methylation domain-containing protein